MAVIGKSDLTENVNNMVQELYKNTPEDAERGRNLLLDQMTMIAYNNKMALQL